MLANKFSSAKDMDNALWILQSGHMTATVQTESGNSYTVIARPKIGVILINEREGKAGKSHHFTVRDGKGYLVNKEGQVVASTTKITVVKILTN